MKRLTRNFLLLTLGVTLGITLTIGHSVLAERDDNGVPLPIDELRTFSEVFANIKNYYVETVDDKDLLDNAIRGMLSGLDPTSIPRPPNSPEVPTFRSS